ncbi:MAG: efflux RND transporter periplasmic adaptor subunit [Thermodesulfobacteriota bacterium]
MSLKSALLLPSVPAGFLVRTLLCLAGACVLAFSSLSEVLSADSPALVKTVRAAKREAREPIVGMGTIRCAGNLKVGFETTGVVRALHVREGDRIEKGQVLAELDNSVLDAQAAVKRAEMKAARAEIDYYREEYRKREELHKKSAVSEAELNKARHELSRAEARVETLSAEVDALGAAKQQRILRSPVAGIVANRYVEEGSVVTPGAHRVFRLVQCQEAIAVIELGEKNYGVIRPGQRVSLTIDAVPGRTYTSGVNRVSPVIDERNRTFTVEATINNVDEAVVFGMFVQATVHFDRDERSVWIPEEALQNHDKAGHMVYVVKDGAVATKQVEIAARSNGLVEIAAGLEPGDEVVVEGQQNFTDPSRAPATRGLGQ